MKSSSAEKIKMTTLDELLGISATQVSGSNTSNTQEPAAEAVVRVPLKDMHGFREHPFRVLDDAKMAETIESIKKYGVLMPGIVRPDAKGGYEIIAGHRRHHASVLAGLQDMPVLIKNLSDDEATIIMVDSNIQREDILPSERAKAYKMKYEALKRIGANGERSDTILGQQLGESRNTIQRYIRLTYLIPELLQMVDDNKLPKNTAADLSFLTGVEQKQVLEVMTKQRLIPSGAQAQKIKEYSKEGKLTETVILLLLEKQEEPSKVNLKSKKIRSFFPDSYTGEQIEKIIYKLLGEWQAQVKNKL